MINPKRPGIPKNNRRNISSLIRSNLVDFDFMRTTYHHMIIFANHINRILMGATSLQRRAVWQHGNAAAGSQRKADANRKSARSAAKRGSLSRQSNLSFHSAPGRARRIVFHLVDLHPSHRDILDTFHQPVSTLLLDKIIFSSANSAGILGTWRTGTKSRAFVLQFLSRSVTPPGQCMNI